MSGRQLLRSVVDRVLAADVALDAKVAAAPTPALDDALRRLSRTADHSVLWMGVAAALALGGDRGRRAARRGLLAVALASATANLVAKPLFPRRRPGPAPGGPWYPARVAPLPTSSSFPSGHSASALAFATAAGHELPVLRLPLHLLAAAVAYSRVHCRVHYPLDVVAGAGIGAVAGQVVGWALGGSLRPPGSG